MLFSLACVHFTVRHLNMWRFRDNVILLLKQKSLHCCGIMVYRIAFVTARPLAFLYDLLKLNFSGNTANLIKSFLSNRKFRTSVKNKIQTSTETHTVVSQSSILSRTFYSLYINDPQHQYVVCIYTNTARNDRCLLRKILRGFTQTRSFFSAGILNLVKIWLRLSLSLVDMDGRSHILHWKNRIFPPWAK